MSDNIPKPVKVVSIVGARPQFIKCAPVSRELRKVATEVLVHTGQHYDDNMSEVFFRDLNIPTPDYNLGVGSGPHGEQTGEMLKRIEAVLMKERPDYVLVYGDTNSTLAGALASAKLHIPVAHVEAGLRSFNKRMPEEINRVLTDHLSDLLFCPTETAVKNLDREGVLQGVHQVGDVMYDALRYNLQIAEKKSKILTQLHMQPREYLLATVHRAENTDDVIRLQAIIEALQEASTLHPVVWPVHPRTRQAPGSFPRLSTLQFRLCLIDPVSYLDMLELERNARAILTDSGGVQKEAYWLQVPCVTLCDETEWVETVEARGESAGRSGPGGDHECLPRRKYSVNPYPGATRVVLSYMGRLARHHFVGAGFIPARLARIVPYPRSFPLGPLWDAVDPAGGDKPRPYFDRG